jgi:transcriptional regulator with XRE-family HTH domain
VAETGITPDQSRIGRAAIGWSEQELADAAGVSRDAVLDLEAGSPPSEAIAVAVLDTLAEAGVSFFHGPDGSIRMRARTLDGIIEAPVTMRPRG